MTGSKFQTLEKWQDLNSKRCTHFFPSITLIPFWNYFLLLSNSQANLPTVEKLIFLSILCNAITLKNIQNHVNKILRWNKRNWCKYGTKQMIIHNFSDTSFYVLNFAQNITYIYSVDSKYGYGVQIVRLELTFLLYHNFI